MNSKYRVHEVAKDFGVKSKVVIDLLLEYFDDTKKHMTALEENELDIIFDSFTTEHAVDSFDAYFATADPHKQAKKPAKKPAEAKKEAAKTTTSAKDKPKTDATAATRKKPPMPFQGRRVPTKPVSKEPVKPTQARTKGAAQTVDTRAGTVEMDKYNEKYEKIARTTNKMTGTDTTVTKQKLKQKSQNYRRRGRGAMRSRRRETESQRLNRIAEERAKKPQMVITVPEEITVGDLAAMMKRTSAEVIKQLMALDVMAAVNETIDYETAEIVAHELGIKVKPEIVVTIEDKMIDYSSDKEENLQHRDPVVVIMGHVDHGKTSLLDAIRDTTVTEGEAGGITQHIGAYRVDIDGKQITFLDTPGHAAFTSMRARGANATDIAILVVAADDGIMPQTIEAINHAKAADVPIVVAINKMDKEGASPDQIMQKLTEYELVPEEWGGDTICVPVSALTKMNLDKLLESILLIAEVQELKANPDRTAMGIVIEARLDTGRGPIATLLVQNGTLKMGDVLVAGSAVGRVRLMMDDKGNSTQSAGPSVPVEIAGLADVPLAGDSFHVVSNERLARELVEQRKYSTKVDQFNAQTKVTLENLFDCLEAGELKELNIIVKADVQGSAEAVKQSLEKLSNDEIQVKIIHSGVGAVSESDVMLANASNAIIIGFNVSSDPIAKQNAEREGVDMHMYRVIYDCIKEIELAIKGMRAPKFRDVAIGRIEVRQVVMITSLGGNVAGCYVLSGKVVRNAKIHVVRDGIIIAESEISSLKRFKDNVKEVAQGYECGIALDKFHDFKEGDIFEAFVVEEYRD